MFLSWLLKQYREIKAQMVKHYPLRIVAVRRLPLTGETVFTVQFVGKSTCVKLKADKIAEDDALIQGFCPRDVKQIMQAALVKKKLTVIAGGQDKEPYKIVAKNFEQENKNPSYVVEQVHGNKRTTKTVKLNDVTKSKEVLLKFSKQDIYEIAYTAGENSMNVAREEIDHSKEN